MAAEFEFKFQLNELVVVAYRRIIGKPNKPGGVGRIKARALENETALYGVAYVLGGKEELIEEQHISLASNSIAPRERKKTEAFTVAVESPKRKKVAKKESPISSPVKSVKRKKANTDVAKGLLTSPSGFYNYPDIEEVPVVEPEPVNDKVYEIAVAFYHEAERRSTSDESVLVDNMKEQFLSTSKDIVEDDDAIKITDDLLNEAMEYLQTVNKIMISGNEIFVV